MIEELAGIEDPNGVQRELIFLGGIHGFPYGDNWVKCHKNSTIAMDPRLTLGIFGSIREKFGMILAGIFKICKVEPVYKSLNGITYEKCKTIITSKDHVVLDYCFSGNDKALLQILIENNLLQKDEKVISFLPSDFYWLVPSLTESNPTAMPN